MRFVPSVVLALGLLSVIAASQARADEGRLKVLVIDGRNNHDWRITTDALCATLRQTGRFSVTISSAPQSRLFRGLRAPRDTSDEQLKQFQQAKARFDALRKADGERFGQTWQAWSPDFAAHDVVVLNYNGANWSNAMQEAFVRYVEGGGGVVVIHAANNAFRDWGAFNDIIGMGWRKGGFGRCLKIDPKTGKPFACCADQNSGHGSKHAFAIDTRAPDHPIMRGLPRRWMHAKDELYHHMRGPANRLTVLASAFADPKQRGTGLHEPIIWETRYGKGRVIVSSLGHHWRGQTDWDSLYCVGFQTTFARSVEYAATGVVTLGKPESFPGVDKAAIKPPHMVVWSKSDNKSDPAKGARASWQAVKSKAVAAMLTPEQERSSFQLPVGYVAELVASEPMVQEPVLVVWDGNGAMYVAEMRSYMQDEKGTGTKTLRNGRVKRLTDTDGDGVMDRATVFVDNLNLPRMILPLDDRIAIVETDTTDVYTYRDTDDDGVADEKRKLYDGFEHSTNKSVEHQDSGLDWNLDNWIYVSYGHRRYRYTDGVWRDQKLHGNWAQWGVTHDDVGRVFFSSNSQPAQSIQMPRRYWQLISQRGHAIPPSPEPLTLGLPYDPDFMDVRNLCPINDRGGAAAEYKRFTSACGQSVFRGHALPHDVYGNYFVCDPTIHAVRRAVVRNVNGKLMLENAYFADEFMLSPDVNFRPVNTATGPDGCLYVVDMYRGIIQDAPWLSEGPRKFIRESGLADNNMHGRIWRIRHRDHQPGHPFGPPRMLNEPAEHLLRHLQHPNGWWRDTAQKLIVLRPASERDKVTPLLEDMVRYTDNPLGRLHALWTLEGIGRVTRNLLRDAYQDRDARIRAAAIKISEPLIAQDEADIIQDLAPMADDQDGEVAKQLVLSLAYSKQPEATAVMEKAIVHHIAHEGVRLAGLIALWKHDGPLIQAIRDGSAFKSVRDPAQRVAAAKAWTGGIEQWDRGMKLPKDMPKAHRDLVVRGERLFYHNCVSCHGANGRGVAVAGLKNALAPPLVGSKRVLGDPDKLILILLHGLAGPVDGKTYEAGVMAPAQTFGIIRDDRLAELLSFIRYAWGNEAGPITKEQVKALRRATSNRERPWTLKELAELER